MTTRFPIAEVYADLEIDLWWDGRWCWLFEEMRA